LKSIVFTGGGTAGHVTPNIALISKLKGKDWHIEYIGSENGIEKELINKIEITYHEILTGKLRRYFDIKNFTDPFRVIKGLFQSYFLIKKIKPNIIFSKGGFVAVPVVIAGFLNKIPVISHESDITIGLANKISIPFSKKVCLSFEEVSKILPKEKTVYTGTPIRENLLNGNKENGFKICGFNTEKPILLVIGGSSGSEVINKILRNTLDKLLNVFQVVHICGKNRMDENFNNIEGYKQFEYLNEELADIFAISNLILSRAGSNAIFEFLALKTPNLLIPLSKKISRGDQILNAESFKKNGYSKVLFEEDLNEENLFNSVLELYEQKDIYIEKMNQTEIKNSVEQIINLIEKISI